MTQSKNSARRSCSQHASDPFLQITELQVLRHGLKLNDQEF